MSAGAGQREPRLALQRIRLGDAVLAGEGEVQPGLGVAQAGAQRQRVAEARLGGHEVAPLQRHLAEDHLPIQPLLPATRQSATREAVRPVQVPARQGAPTLDRRAHDPARPTATTAAAAKILIGREVADGAGELLRAIRRQSDGALQQAPRLGHPVLDLAQHGQAQHRLGVGRVQRDGRVEAALRLGIVPAVDIRPTQDAGLLPGGEAALCGAHFGLEFPVVRELGQIGLDAGRGLGIIAQPHQALPPGQSRRLAHARTAGQLLQPVHAVGAALLAIGQDLGIGQRQAQVVRRRSHPLAELLRGLAIARLRGGGERLIVFRRQHRRHIAVPEQLAVARHRLSPATRAREAPRGRESFRILAEQTHQFGQAGDAGILRRDPAQALEIALRNGALSGDGRGLGGGGDGVDVIGLGGQQAFECLKRALRLALLLPELRLLEQIRRRIRTGGPYIGLRSGHGGQSRERGT